jgi:tetratricopeptide (TPR) repeat protein/tRNA A-37 threonylcarbamoyl transferase component Bud32
MTTATRYTRFRHHRKGGMSILRIAHDEDLDRETVVKTLREEYQDGDAFRRQLLAEASITGKLDHPGIVPVYGVGHDWDGRPFYTMRRIDGEDLHSHVERHHAASNTGMPAEQVLDLRDLVEHLVDACNTIAYAHDAGVLHLDIKPQNIMVGRYGETFVVDWGLARPFERSTEFRNEPTVALREDLRGGLEAFTRPFVSPEQYAGGALGPAADIYSLGATLYFIIAGVTGLRGDEPDFRDRLASGRVPPARSRRPGVPKALDAICQRAMQAQPSGRYPTAKALAADLQAWLRDEPVSALPERLTDRCLRQVRRHAGIVATAGVALPVVAAAVVAAGVLWNQRDRYHRIADEKQRYAARAEEAEKLAKQQSQRADARFEDAVNTFEAIAEPMATENWRNVVVLGEVAGLITKFSGGVLDELAAGDSTDDMTTVRRKARINELKAIAASIGSQISLEDLREAERLFEEARRAGDDDPIITRRLARNRLLQAYRLFNSRDLGTIREALEKLQAACLGFESLLEAGDETSDQLQLAEVHHELGRCHLWLADNDPTIDGAKEADRRLQESLDEFNRGLQIRDNLHRVKPKDEAVTRDLARSYGFRGDLHVRMGELSKASDDYIESEQLRRTLYTSYKSNIDHRYQLARGLANFVGLQRMDTTADIDAAITSLEEAKEIQRRLRDDYDDNATFRRAVLKDLAASAIALADLRLMKATRAEQPDEADLLCRKADEAATEAFLALDAIDVVTPDVMRSRAISKVLQAEATRNDGARRAAALRIAFELFKALEGENRHDRQSLWALAVAYGLTDQKAEAIETFQRVLNRGGKDRAQYESRFRTGGSLEQIAGDEAVSKALETLRVTNPSS